MNIYLPKILQLTSKIIIIGTSFVLPLLFLNLTTEFYETPKFLLMFLVTGILLILWASKWFIEGKVSFLKTPVDIALILFLLSLMLATFFSPTKNLSIIGNLPKIHGSLISYVIYVLFFWVIASNLKRFTTAKEVVYALVSSGFVLSILSLLSYFNIDILQLSFTKAVNFTPTGSSFSTTAFLSLLLPFLLMGLLNNKSSNIIKVLPIKIFLTLITSLFVITIFLTGVPATYIAASLATVIILYITSPSQVRANSFFLSVPAVLLALIVVFSILPIAGSKNILYSKSQNFPREIQLSYATSWKVSVSSFRDSPFWGTGPATYLFNFTTYKPVEFNNTKYWSVRFDNAFNEYLNILATAGGIGIISFLLFTVIILSKAIQTLGKKEISDQSRGNWSKAAACSSILFISLLALHPSTLILWSTGGIILGLFLFFNNKLTEEISINTMPLIPGVVIAGLVITGTYFASNLALADYYHRLALNAVSNNNGLAAYNSLVAAEKINPYSDLYRIDLAQTNFALANAIASSKGPNESSPAGSLTDQDKQNIQVLLSQAINEGKASVALSPRNPANFEVLGALYRQISGVAQNAGAFSLDAYGRAIQQDPLNPLLRLTVGGLYYSAKNYDLAIRFFTDAINLKPDFANGYFNLAVVLKDKGDLEGAAAAAEKVVSLVDPKSTDYTVASQFLSQLKDTLATKSANTKVSLPTPTPKSALESKKMPKVLDLPKPDSISTPEAIKKPQ